MPNTEQQGVYEGFGRYEGRTKTETHSTSDSTGPLSVMERDSLSSNWIKEKSPGTTSKGTKTLKA